MRRKADLRTDLCTFIRICVFCAPEGVSDALFTHSRQNGLFHLEMSGNDIIPNTGNVWFLNLLRCFMGRALFLSCEIWRSAGKVSDIIRDICIKIDERTFEIEEFSDGIDHIGIIVNCHPEGNMLDGWGKPRKYINYKKRSADIRLPIPYVEFVSAKYEDQYLMVVKNIVESIRVIGDKCAKSKRSRFDSDGLVNKFLEKLGISEESLENVVGVITDEEYKKLMEENCEC